MVIAVKALIMGFSPAITSQNKLVGFHTSVPGSRRHQLSLCMRHVDQENFRRTSCKSLCTARVVSSERKSPENLDASCAENLDASVSSFNDFSVAASVCQDREMKIRLNVSGARTQATFEDVFSKLVAAAQPIPGFRRVKGGKTPDIPKDILLHIIGSSKVYKKSIKAIINSTVAEYVEKEALKVTENLRVEQSIEELEGTFAPGKGFGFDAILQLKENLN